MDSIHNALKALSGEVNVIVEGIAASAASVIMCAGDTVTVYPGSLIMIHGVSVMLWDYMNMQDMKQLMKGMDASERAVAEIYNSKTGIEVDAQSCGVCFSTLAGEGGLLDCMVCQLPIREKAILFAHAVAASAAGSGLVDPRKAPQYLKFCQFADLVAADPALAKSVEGRDRYDFQKPNTRSKAYKAALACL